MQTPFQLDRHPRRPQPLSEPPAGYFDQLPTRVMARLPRPEATESRGWGWLLALPPALRTSLASTLLLGGFAASFWLSQPRAASLDRVPQAQLVSYLLSPDARVETNDLAELAATHPGLTATFVEASRAELNQALDDQPTEEFIL